MRLNPSSLIPVSHGRFKGHPAGSLSAGLTSLKNSFIVVNQPASSPVQFGGLFYGNSRGLVNFSLAVWAGLLTAVGGGITQRIIHQRPQVQSVQALDKIFQADAARIQESADAVAKADPAQADEALKAHHALVQETFINEARAVEINMGPHLTQEAVLGLVKESGLTDEDKAATYALIQGQQDALGQPPEVRMQQWADTVLSKHADAETVTRYKESMQDMFAQVRSDQSLGNILLYASILGGLVSAGILGLSAIGGGLGSMVILLVMAPMTGIEHLKKRRKKV